MRSAALTLDRVSERVPLSSRSSSLHWLWLLSRDSGALVGGSIVLAVLLLALFGPSLTGYDPFRAEPFNRLLAPSSSHWLGTDALGRDELTRMLYGARISLLVGLGTTLASTLLGGLVGLIAGYFRAVDGLLMRIMDGLMAFPSILLAVAIMAVRGPSVENVILAITVTTVPRLARLIRGQVLVTRELAYVEAATAVGAKPWQILIRHILPNSFSPLIIQGSFTFAVAVVTEASLSFLGAGVPPQQPTWGNMLQEGMAMMTVAPWVSVFPGLALAITVLGLNLLGDGLRDSLDPRIGEVSA
ncbi:MAG: ABC transporter permease [Ardenticatenaceae bacterium]|nr:ABC transporter permease [Ardenticatenaceae bacterium]HBY96278.1 peptide ABC transporter permease [Chloroflexota bacterium]